jgi:hypothetical protein
MNLKLFAFVLLLSTPALAQGVDPSLKKYVDVQKHMRDLVRAYPQNAEIFELITSDSGQKIEGLKIGNGPVANLVVATHHGNEYGSTEVAMGFLENTVVQPVLGQTVYVIPVLNAAGYDRKQRREPARSTTFDPNRDYPGPCGTDGPFNLKSTRALADFVATKGIISSATLHTFSNMVLYPWGISTRDTRTPYEDLFMHLGKLAASFSGYTVGNSTELLYPADGTFEDYAFWKHGVWSLLLEMGSSHSPTASAVEKMVRENAPGIRKMLEEAPQARATEHAFTGKCDTSLKSLDRRDE